MRRYWHIVRNHHIDFHPLTFFLIGIAIGILTAFFHVSNSTQAESATQQTVTVQVSGSMDDVNEITGSFGGAFDSNTPPTNRSMWIGGNSSAFAGLRFANVTVPQGATIRSAKLLFYTPTQQWIYTEMEIAAENNGNANSFSITELPSKRALTTAKINHSSDKKWAANSWNELANIASSIQEVVSRSDWNSGNSIAVIIRGAGGEFGRKYVSSADGGKGAKLEITYTMSSAQPTQSPTSTPTPLPSPTPTPQPTAVPTMTSRPTLTPTPTPILNVSPTPTPAGSGLTSLEYGTWVPQGSQCSKEIHDSYYVIGTDGKKYSTWHPARDPKTGCVFGHEHGDDPRTAIVDNTLPAFGYAGEAAGMFEGHTGFKVFVANAGTVNDEGRTNLHNSRIVFHMGTGGTKRFTERFHSMEYKVITNDGRKMFVQGLADIGQVGTICDNPRQQRTVMAFGCRLESSYEIWENVLRIRKNGETIAAAITSTAVFDPILVMDPADKTRVVYTWSDEANQIFVFSDDRSYYRGCERESYHGPTNWYNNGSGSSTVYYTDAYGNVTPNGTLKQEISQHGYKNFIATNDGLSQFKYRKSACVSGLGLSN